MITSSRREAIANYDPERDGPEPWDAIPAYIFQNGRRCFYCHDVMRDAAEEPGVMWAGSGHEIFLHAACAVSFAHHVSTDGLHALEGLSHRESMKRRETDHDPIRAVQDVVRETDGAVAGEARCPACDNDPARGWSERCTTCDGTGTQP